MKKLVKIETTFKELFDLYSKNNKIENEVVGVKRKMFVRGPDGKLKEVIGLIKKTNQTMVESTYSNNLKFKCSNKHWIKTTSGYKFIKDVNKNDDILLYNNDSIKITNKKIISKNSDVYDLALDENTSHEYVTPNGLIHHNTTIARIFCSKNGILDMPKDNVLEINGSARETRGISFVQDVIEPFLKIPPSGMDKYKVVFIDEADYLTDASFHSMRGIIEKYSKYCRFIFTCNYVSKIPEALQSRFQSYAFKQIPVEFANDYCKNILDKENIKYDDKSLKFVIDNLYPDIRKIVGTLQKCSLSGELKVNKEVVATKEKATIASIIEICNNVKNNNSGKVNQLLSDILNLVSDQDLEFRGVYSNLFYCKDLPVPAKIIVNKYCNKHQECLVPSMNFMAMVFEISKALQAYYARIQK